LQHLNLSQLQHDVLGLLSFACHLVVLLKTGYSYPKRWTTSVGALHYLTERTQAKHGCEAHKIGNQEAGNVQETGQHSQITVSTQCIDPWRVRLTVRF
ncbi:hypothetical protein, partial [Tritonibacter scottomollicae]|uniref:hypothetical protein n=1 Tax=Tritonibacter scottomollicae TaxID=483013 RepID=UPI003AA94EC6